VDDVITADAKAHWSNVYQTKAVDDVSWYQVRPEMSLELMQECGVKSSNRIIDVGAGASTLVDHLLDSGYKDITLLDVSGKALEIVRNRLGTHASAVSFIEANINSVELPFQTYDLWHDRATFHFLTNVTMQQRYVKTARHSVKPGGHVILATFAQDGPTQCSGLDVARQSPETLQQLFGDGFDLITCKTETHRTPWNTEQQFIYCCWKRQS